MNRGYYEKGKKYLQIIFSQELDDLEADFIMQSSTDYNLWKNGVVATAESLETAGIPVDQKTYNNWIYCWINIYTVFTNSVLTHNKKRIIFCDIMYS